MKYYELTKEEKKLLSAVEKGEFRSVGKNTVTALRYAARATLGKIRNINIRLSERDVQKLKARAAQKGMPYQTLVSSVLHQYTAKENQ